MRNKNNQQIATVEDLQLRNGKIAAILIATGGFLGMGEDY